MMMSALARVKRGQPAGVGRLPELPPVAQFWTEPRLPSGWLGVRISPGGPSSIGILTRLFRGRNPG